MKGLYMLILIAVLGCSDKNRYAGVEVIPTPAMTRVLWDIMQVDEFATYYLTRDSSKDINLQRIKLYGQVFKLHHVTEQEFAASFKYYSARPDLMKQVFDTLSARAEREKQHVMVPDSTKLK